tara:strand:- start:2967 stop:4394 length:1428 start_codon:yes stop_codon:yes gene_type:complete
MNYLTNKQLQEQIVNAGLSFGLDYHSNDKRIKNPNNIKSHDFIKLLESIGYNNINVIPPKNGNNRSSVFNAYQFNDGKKDRMVVLADNVSGRGTNQTKYQELSFLLILSAYQQFGENDIINKISLLECYNKVLDNGKPIDRNTVDGIVDFLNNKTTWYNSIILQVKKLDNYLQNKSPLYYVRDYKGFKLNKLAESLFKKDVSTELKWDSDKWNPSDIWLVYNKKLPKFNSLKQLNRYLYKSITSINGIFGISLKKGNGELEEINFEKNILNLNSFKIKFGKFFTQNLYTLYGGRDLDGTSIVYRIFNANSNEIIRGECEKKKTNAAHGKVYLNYLSHLDEKSDVCEMVKFSSGNGNFKYLNNKWILTDVGKDRFKLIKSKYKIIMKSDILDKIDSDFNVLLSESDFMNKINDLMENSNLTEFDLNKKISARFQTIVLGAYFCDMYSENKLYEIASDMLLYAKSMTDWSSPHLKLQ